MIFDVNTHDWEFWIDVGGTFTDCIACRPDGALVTHKLLSSGVYKGQAAPGSTAQGVRDPARSADPDGFFDGWQLNLANGSNANGVSATVARFERADGVLHLAQALPATPALGTRYELRCPLEAPVVGMRWLLGRHPDAELGPVRVRLGTTRATNALLERQGAPTALVTTQGFGDVLRIAYQNRPRLFELNVRKPIALYRAAVELDERLDAAGGVLRPLDANAVRAALEPLREIGITSLAVCLLHAYRNGAHEQVVAEVAQALGFAHVSLSSRVSPLPKIVTRGDTTVADAYLTPVLRDYAATLVAQAPQAAWKFMTSAGGLCDVAHFTGKDAILSGPAGGVVGAARVAQQAGFGKIIGFDMGGTSTDVCRFDGAYERRYEMEAGDGRDSVARIVAPMLAVETVAAGGGSVCWFDGQKPVVGPRSAGAEPGPACYGKGGPLCVTDINLFLGKLLPAHFPFPLDRDAVTARLDELIDQIEAATGRRYEREALAAGFTAIANANMAAPIRRISLARGYDVRDYTLVSFGGAGAQHACAVASELGMRRILCHPLAGVLSALGIGLADVAKFAERAIGQPLETVALEPIFQEMEREAHAAVLAEDVAPERIQTPRRLLDMRYHGQEARLTVPQPADDDWATAFAAQHRQLYGFDFPSRSIEIYAARVEATGETARPPAPRHAVQPRQPQPERHTPAYFDGAYHDTAVHHRAALQPGDEFPGPAIVLEPVATIVVDPGWTAQVTAENNLVLTSTSNEQPATSNQQRTTSNEPPDPIELELFNNHFASIAEQMGTALQKTAISTNVKERLDFSCAIFTPDGDLVVNAPHIPVHLGAMSECVKCLRQDAPAMAPGDIFVTNDPFRGGSHLPDVTVVTPVFDQQPATGNEQPVFFVASRAHHAEIGGITPGSMPPFSRSLAEEGVLIRHFQLAQAGVAREDELRRLLASGPYPSRSVEENIADINAQVAANQTGAALLGEMAARHGLDKVAAYMGHIQRAAEQKMRAALLKIAPGAYRFADALDDGTPIVVTITVRHEAGGGAAVIDFCGSGPVLPGNLNANRAIVTSAVLYCFRCLIDEPIPLNSGVLAPLEIVLPPDSLLNPPVGDDPAQCPAVVGGNVETSQRVVDVIFGALGVVAASQGTMNNFLFGRGADAGAAFGYYETIGGGTGAGPGFAGADAVHCHMTNTRLTDPEVLETRYPVRLRRCAIRRGSGGPGRWRGGDGMIREIEFLAPLAVSLLTSRRATRPYGLAGGQPGQAGRNLLRRVGQAEFEGLPGAALLEVSPGDVLRIETPGGGGFGEPGL